MATRRIINPKCSTRRINVGSTARRIDPVMVAKALGAEIVDRPEGLATKGSWGVGLSGGIPVCMDCGVLITEENDSGWALVEPWSPADTPTKPLCKGCCAKLDRSTEEV